MNLAFPTLASERGKLFSSPFWRTLIGGTPWSGGTDSGKCELGPQSLAAQGAAKTCKDRQVTTERSMPSTPGLCCWDVKCGGCVVAVKQGTAISHRAARVSLGGRPVPSLQETAEEVESGGRSRPGLDFPGRQDARQPLPSGGYLRSGPGLIFHSAASRPSCKPNLTWAH